MLDEATLMQLATVENGKPWVCNVWFAADDDLNIYWFTSVNRRHSKEIAKDSRVAGIVHMPCEPTDPVRGLTFEGAAEVLEIDSDVERAMKVYAGRIFTKDRIRELSERTDQPHRFYRMKPKSLVLFDALNFPTSPRQEWRP
jgi:uncharacterized protein YhbP (UPF0306 family)